MRTVVEDFTGSHAKEVLTVDLDGKGVSTLFSVVEAETKRDKMITAKRKSLEKQLQALDAKRNLPVRQWEDG